jgi:midasin (ATPase involved in ribosome maturation)
MMHTCTDQTDLDELIGNEHWEGQHLMFHYGPLAQAMKEGEELVLENSRALSIFMVAKMRFMIGDIYIDDTAELIHPHDGFRLTLK